MITRSAYAFLRPARHSLLIATSLLISACGSDGSSGPPTGVSPTTSQPTDPGVNPVSPATTTGGDTNTGAPVSPDDPIIAVPSGQVDEGAFRPSEKVDILFVVDNSVSMGDKQALFKQAVGDMIDQLVNPPCLNSSTNVLEPVEEGGACPTGTKRIFEPVKDIHLGVISSSLGPRGAQGQEILKGCEDQPRGNDKGYLIPFVRDGLLASSYNNSGFLSWDPDQKQSPPGIGDMASLISGFQAQVDAVGEDGCGYEAPLEAAYRFLIDPDPYETIQRVPCGTEDPPLCAAPSGTDQELLNQRAAFLRPDSVVVVMYLTDENDCSIRAFPQGFMALRADTGLANGTATCETDPNNVCCHSCSAAAIPDGCPDAASNGCQGAAIKDAPDAANIRCFDQKRRFGTDFLRKTQIYSQGFTGMLVPDRNNQEVPNPLVTATRGKQKVFVVGIVGVPWQDTATAETLSADKQFDLRREKETTWDVFLGAQPSDPFVQESTDMRSGPNPFVPNEVLGGPGTWNSINGHDRPIVSGDGLVDDLQYACIYPLNEPRDCAEEGSAASCDCAIETLNNVTYDYSKDNPLCWDQDTQTYTTVQRYAKAYPGTRLIEVIRDVGPQGVLASICPKQTTASDQQDYVYRPVIRALLLNVSTGKVL